LPDFYLVKINSDANVPRPHKIRNNTLREVAQATQMKLDVCEREDSRSDLHPP
jgi:hypothetical protein